MATADPVDDATAVRCHGLVKLYRSATSETYALRGLDLVLRRGVLTVVAGPSGSGKSSLLHLVAARDRPSAGELDVLGTDLATAAPAQLRRLRRRRIGFVAQRSATALFPHLSAAQQLRQVAALRGGPLDVTAALEAVDLGGRADHRPRTSSGGEQQRLAVAASLVGAPDLIVADEPTAELDHENADLVMSALVTAARQGSAVVVSSHDHRVVSRADRVLRLRHGVLSSEQEGVGAATTAVIDSTGRLQLPPEALDLFPDGRAAVHLVDGEVVLRAPGGPA